MISISPNQNAGIDVKISAVTVLVMSMTEYCFIAEMMPTGTPMIVARTIA